MRQGSRGGLCVCGCSDCSAGQQHAWMCRHWSQSFSGNLVRSTFFCSTLHAACLLLTFMTG
jgi:hypothetical protein